MRTGRMSMVSAIGAAMMGAVAIPAPTGTAETRTVNEEPAPTNGRMTRQRRRNAMRLENRAMLSEMKLASDNPVLVRL